MPEPQDSGTEPLDGATEPLDGAAEPLDGAAEPLDGGVERGDAQGGGEAVGTTPGPATPSPDTAPSTGRAVATDLDAHVECVETPRPRPVAHLRWRTAPRRGDAQRVDVTTRRDGFDIDVYDSSSLLPADAASLDWERINGQAVHYWRVATRHGSTWHTSAVQTFEGPVCAADYQPQPQR